MKKNKFMRVASVLLVLTLLSTCAISGTFAKYTTSGTDTDTARVAKWGVLIGMDADTFGRGYAAATTDTKITENTGTVWADAKVDVVAPGTKGDFYFSITGKPEVTTNVQIDLESSSAIKLDAGTYTDYTKANATETFEATEYMPIMWTLKQSKTATAPTDWSTVTAVSGCENVSLATIATILNATSNSAIAVSETDDLYLTYGYYQLSWVWAFDGNEQADTYLGQSAASDTALTGTTLNETFSLTISATQVD